MNWEVHPFGLALCIRSNSLAVLVFGKPMLSYDTKSPHAIANKPRITILFRIFLFAVQRVAYLLQPTVRTTIVPVYVDVLWLKSEVMIK